MGVYLRIKRDILECTLAPGQIIRESQAAAEYGVGRTSVREALQGLAHAGLVKAIPRVGYVVSGISVKDVIDLFGVRAIVEPAATRLAAENASSDEIDRLRALAEPGPVLDGKENHVVLTRRNSAFHHAIAECSHNGLLAWIEFHIAERLERVLNLRSDIPDIAERMTEQHRALADAVARGNGQEAWQSSLDQIETSTKRVLEAVFEGPVGDELSIANPA